ncbi:hypothetical protein EJB05_12323, partial [Eragrostis curvula]
MVQSAAMSRLRRKLQTSRTTAALAPAEGVAKKPSTPPLCHAPSSSPAPRPARHADGDTRLDRVPPSPFVFSRQRHPAEQDDNKNSSISFRQGAHVRVRTPVGTLCTGQRLVLWLGAVVVSAAEEEGGYLCVAYTHHKHPRTDPSGAVRVPKKDVKDMLMLPKPAVATATEASAGSSTVTSSHSAAPPQGDQPTAAPVRRPTTAGKSPSLLKKMEKEMRSRSDAILASCGVYFFCVDEASWKSERLELIPENAAQDLKWCERLGIKHGRRVRARASPLPAAGQIRGAGGLFSASGLLLRARALPLRRASSSAPGSLRRVPLLQGASGQIHGAAGQIQVPPASSSAAGLSSAPGPFLRVGLPPPRASPPGRQRPDPRRRRPDPGAAGLFLRCGPPPPRPASSSAPGPLLLARPLFRAQPVVLALRAWRQATPASGAAAAAPPPGFGRGGGQLRRAARGDGGGGPSSLPASGATAVAPPPGFGRGSGQLRRATIDGEMWAIKSQNFTETVI